jgi:hypothetical protein
MQIELNLLLATSVKVVVLIIMAGFLFGKWIKQEHHYGTDFPFLMAIGFALFGIVKIVDIIYYDYFGKIANITEFTGEIAVFLARVRFGLGVLSVLPVMVLMLIIWFGGKRKVQALVGIVWGVLSFTSLMLAKTLKDFLQITQIYAFPPILLSCITFFIIHKQQKLPQINSLFIAIGWLSYIFLQIIRPVWYNLGQTTFGLAWVAELIEMVALMGIGLGFFRPASYNDTAEKQQYIARNDENSINNDSNDWNSDKTYINDQRIEEKEIEIEVIQ